MNNPKRVLHIIGALNYGGAETLLMELYRHINRFKVQFDFFVYCYGKEVGAYEKEIQSLGGKIYHASKRLYQEPFAFRKEILDFCKKHKEYRIVHSHMNMRGGYMLQPFHQGLRCTTIAHSHTAHPCSSLKNKFINRIGKLLLKHSVDFYMGCSEEALIAICDKQSDGISRFLLQNAIDTDKFLYSKDLRYEYRNNFGAGNNTIVFCNVARFTPEKNHNFQIDIFASLLSMNSDCLLVFVGDGPEFEKIKCYAKEKLEGQASKVLFLGARSDVNKILNACDVFLFPSKGEGLGIVAIEAQANGLPCVMSKDVIPEEADVHSGLVTRVSLSESAYQWAEKCMQVGTRLESSKAIESIKKAGYDIKQVSQWLEDFYLNHWKE